MQPHTKQLSYYKFVYFWMQFSLKPPSMDPSERSQPDFELLFNATPGNYLILLPDAPHFTIIAVSDAYARVTMSVREHMIGKKLFELFPDNPNDPAATGVLNLSASLHHVIHFHEPHKMEIQKYDIPYPDGHGFEERYWSPLNTPVLNKEHLLYIIHQVDDVTEKVKTKEKLEVQTEVLKRTNAELEQFVRISSHDLQEPLRKIRTFAGLLKATSGDSLSQSATMQIDKIYTSAERMSDRLRDLLQYAFLQKKELFMETDLNEVYWSVHEDLDLLIAEKKAQIKVDGLPVIQGVKHQLHQLFYNLIFNALQYAKPDVPPRISIDVTDIEGDDDSGNYHEIVVTDNGIGFAQEHAEKIFTVFERLQRNGSKQGTGIGLAICKKVVQNHGGKIFAVSSPGAGAQFHVLLPATPDMATVKKLDSFGENTV
jgi:signal transduction histidine kinase